MRRVIGRIEVPWTVCTLLAEYLGDGAVTKAAVTVPYGICRSRELIQRLHMEESLAVRRSIEGV